MGPRARIDDPRPRVTRRGDHNNPGLVRRTTDGWFTQLAVSSVATDPEGKPKDVFDGKEHYTPELVKLEPNHAPDTLDRRRAVLAEEAKHIDRFTYADTWGHAVVSVRGRTATETSARSAPSS